MQLMCMHERQCEPFLTEPNVKFDCIIFVITDIIKKVWTHLASVGHSRMDLSDLEGLAHSEDCKRAQQKRHYFQFQLRNRNKQILAQQPTLGF